MLFLGRASVLSVPMQLVPIVSSQYDASLDLVGTRYFSLQ